MRFSVQFSEAASRHLRGLTARQRALVLDEVQRLLTTQPALQTRNRKPLRPNPVSPRELRVQRLRIYYDVQEEGAVVTVEAIGIKVRDVVLIEGREVQL